MTVTTMKMMPNTTATTPSVVRMPIGPPMNCRLLVASGNPWHQVGRQRPTALPESGIAVFGGAPLGVGMAKAGA